MGDDAASPEVACALSDIWKTMDNLVPAADIPATIDFGGTPVSSAPSPTNENYEYSRRGDDSNLSMDDIVAFVTQTSALKTPKEKARRPRFAVKNLRRFWSDERVSDLFESVNEAGRKWTNRSRRRRRPFIETVYKEWLRRRGKREDAGPLAWQAARAARPEGHALQRGPPQKRKEA